MLIRTALRRSGTVLVAAVVAGALLGAQAAHATAPRATPPGTLLGLPNTGAVLDAALDLLNRTARVPGSAWAIDPPTNQVLVLIDPTVVGPNLAILTAVVNSLGTAVRMERTAGVLRIAAVARGAAPTYASNGGRCSIGFNVRKGSVYYFLTAGHCARTSTNWYADAARATRFGGRVSASFPNNDFGLIKYMTGGVPPGNITLYGNPGVQEISGVANAVMGQAVKRSGNTTGVRAGKVTALNATVNYAEGSVYGMVKTDACAEVGDSGGPFFAGTTALGLTSGIIGDCRTAGGISYFQPVTEALSVYGVVVY